MTQQQNPVVMPPSWAASHVKGGTTTAASDAQEEAEFRDAEARRDQALRDKEASVHVRPQGVPNDKQEQVVADTIEQAVAANKAVMYSCMPTQNPNVPTGYIVVEYVNRFGEVYNEGVIDLLMGTPDDPNELVIEMFCPRCIERKKHNQGCIIQIRKSNRQFEFLPKPGLKRDCSGALVRELGVITASEKFTCPQCSWSARFENNRVREE